ncbi:hypothetical protein F5Y17DRAFT_452258 [Xylariaceae sp. FL0594]|nr:hypothetical protein F5Y17DRAFT_452258 [Xylariaceae sp. FL0594]
MDSISRKRTSLELDDADRQSHYKRQRAATLHSHGASIAPSIKTTSAAYEVVKHPTAENLHRDSLRRSITLALRHVGFDAAHGDALEGFTEAVETYIAGFIGHIKRVAHASRRSDSIPTDFETALCYYNLPPSSLKPHLQNPIDKQYLDPTFYDPIIENTTYLESPPPVLGDELDGRYEKEERAWIPKHFPSFPSKHTYRYTPAELPVRKTQKKREEALADARKGEMALRRIDRAAKITRHNELKQTAERHALAKKRHGAWEGLMKSLLPKHGAGTDASEIADHSTIVDAGAKYARKELPRTSRRVPALAALE